MSKKSTTKKTTQKATQKSTQIANNTVKKVAKKAAKKTVKKTTTKTAKKTTVRKTTKKAAAKKPISKTTIAARVDVGFGNNLYIRGEGAGLSWDVFILMKNLSPYEWAWEAKNASKPIEYKLLINDELWANGENQFAMAGDTAITAPTFTW